MINYVLTINTKNVSQHETNWKIVLADKVVVLTIKLTKRSMTSNVRFFVGIKKALNTLQTLSAESKRQIKEFAIYCLSDY